MDRMIGFGCAFKYSLCLVFALGFVVVGMGGICVNNGRWQEINSVVDWVAGPFVYPRQLCNGLAESQQEGLVSTSPEAFVVDVSQSARSVASTLRARSSIRAVFTSSADCAESVDLMWAPFRGNINLVALGPENEALILHPGTETVQYTTTGHLFVVLCSSNCDTASSDMETLPSHHHPGFQVLESQMARIVGMHLMVPSEETVTVEVCPSEMRTANMQRLFARSGLSHCSEILEDGDPVHNVDISRQRRDCFRQMLLYYWEQQRLSQVAVHSWAVPELPTIDRTSSQTDDGPSTNTVLWTLTSLSREVAIEAEMWHKTHRSSIAAPEPPISLVFNQLESPTYYVPLPDHLLQSIEVEVHAMVAAWLGLPEEELEVTGSYASREYRSDAVVRWHVDPVETQPLTAIIHITDNSGVDSRAWALQVPRSLTTFDRYNASSVLNPTAHNTDSLSNDTGMCDDENLHNIHLLPGQVLLLQSAKLPHARLGPYAGEWYANAFVHLAPRRWADREDIKWLIG